MYHFKKKAQEDMCACKKLFKTKKSLSHHKKTCLTHTMLMIELNKKVIDLLPKNIEYKIISNEIHFTYEDFNTWFEKLNSNFKYSVKNSKKIEEKFYKKIICKHSKIFDCGFEINLMIDGENFSIKAKNCHNHIYDDTKALLNNPVSGETKKILTDLFYQGETPTGALKELKRSSENYISQSTDRSIIPNLNDVYYLFKKEKIVNFGKANLDSISIEKLLDENKHCMRLKYEYFEENFIVAFFTVKMFAALAEDFISSQVICIDSSGGMDRSSGRLFNLVIPGPVGASQSECLCVFQKPQKSFKKDLPFLKIYG